MSNTNHQVAHLWAHWDNDPKHKAARARAWERNGEQVRVGAFQIDRISANGDIRAGCHLIPWSESERIARQIGLFDLAVDGR